MKTLTWQSNEPGKWEGYGPDSVLYASITRHGERCYEVGDIGKRWGACSRTLELAQKRAEMEFNGIDAGFVFARALDKAAKQGRGQGDGFIILENCTYPQDYPGGPLPPRKMRRMVDLTVHDVEEALSLCE